MTALVGKLSDLLTLLVQAFNLSAIFPAIAFVLLNYLVVFPLLTGTVILAQIERIEAGVQTFIIAVFVIGLAYALSAVNHLIVRLFEGYPLIDQFPFDARREHHLGRMREVTVRIGKITEAIDRLEVQIKSTPILKRAPLRQFRQLLIAERNALLGEQLFLYPISEARVLPTRMGNVIASAEDYPQQLFGIDTVLMWPFLVPTLSETGYAKYIEREKSVFDLLLNSTVLFALLGLELVFLDGLLLGITPKILFDAAIVGGSVVLLYWLTGRGALGYALTIRTAFILHRHKLIDALGLIKPDSYKAEFELWTHASEFYRNPRQATELADDNGLFCYETDSAQLTSQTGQMK